jgi:hypothetical protein
LIEIHNKRSEVQILQPTLRYVQIWNTCV